MSPLITVPSEFVSQDGLNLYLLQEIARMSATIDALETQVAETNTVIASAVVLISGLRDQLIAIQAELAALGIDNVKLNDLTTSLDESEQALAAAVATNP